MEKERAENMGFPGIELKWQPGSDNNWISYYEIFRDGHPLDKVAKGTFYFDHSAGADLAADYEVRAVDGAGNVSARVVARGTAGARSQIHDDAPGGGIEFNPGWKHSTEEPLVAHKGTITSASERGYAAELTFQGKRVLWFTKHSPENGEAAVSIDGGPAEIVDTYSADDIWGVGIYRKSLPGRAGTGSGSRFLVGAAFTPMSGQKRRASLSMGFGPRWNSTPVLASKVPSGAAELRNASVQSKPGC